MRRAGQARAGPYDPQSGPSRALGSSGFFHFALKWIVADPGKLSGLRVSNYINRLEEIGGAAAQASDLEELEIGWSPSGLRASDYVNRIDPEGATSDELGAHVLVTLGLPVATGAQLARLLDAAERKADRTYRCYGGRLPRVATHANISIRYGVSSEQAGRLLQQFTTLLSNRLRVPLEGRVHNKAGRPDHIHLVIGTRIVENGRLGKKCRALDAVSEKADGRLVDVGERFVGATIEWMRSEWARLMREASGDLAIDHKSYERRGLTITPVTHVPRADIEYERRRKTASWRERRRRELAMRSGPAEGSRYGVAAFASAPAPKVEIEAVRLPSAANSREAKGAGLTDAPADPANDVSPGASVSSPTSRSSPQPNHPINETVGRPAKSPKVEGEALTGSLDRWHQTAPSTPSVKTYEGRVRADVIRRASPLVPSDPGVAGTRFEPPKPEPRSSQEQVARVAKNPPTVDLAMPRQPELKPHRDLAAATSMFRVLQHQKRLSVSRVEELARTVGMDCNDFETVVVAAAPSASPQPDTVPQIVPHHLARLWETWIEEDNEARRLRRARAKLDEHSSNISPTSMLPPTPGSDRPVRVEMPREDQAPSIGANGQKPIPEKVNEPLAHRLDPTSTPPKPMPIVEVPSRPDYRSRPEDAMASGTLERAIVKAFAADVVGMAKRDGNPQPSAEALDRAVGVRLRLTGRNEDEVAAILATCAGPNSAGDRERFFRLAAYAFSDATTERLRKRPSFGTRIRAIEADTEAKLFRKLRLQALDHLRRDLDDVWVHHRMQADDAKRRHARRLKFLQDLCWRSKRARRRSGLTVALLSALVELAVLRPLISRQQAMATADLHELNARTRAAAAEIKRLRQSWRDHVLRPNTPSATNGEGHAPRSADAERNAGDKRAGTHRGAAIQSSMNADERQQLVLGLALVVAARGAWSKQRAQKLSHLAGVAEGQLWPKVRETCRQRYEHAQPENLVPDQVTGEWNASWQKAQQAGWKEVLGLMRDIAGGRAQSGRDGKSDGKGR